jgi:FlaA1/EpsC-like NDP-sugar epimerase
MSDIVNADVHPGTTGSRQGEKISERLEISKEAEDETRIVGITFSNINSRPVFTGQSMIPSMLTDLQNHT